MKKIQIRKIEIRNFKASASQIIDNIPDGGLVISGHNGSGKSSILEAIVFALGGSIEAGKVINQTTTKAPASVSLTIGVDTYTRTLTPTLDASGKIIASSSSYVISGVPCKKTEYDIRINQLFGTKDWIYLLNPSLAMQNKSNRNLLLAVAGCPSEKEFLEGHNPQLANIIGNTSFEDFEKREKATIQAIGKKIDSIPAKIEELSAMLQDVPELEDEAQIHARLAEIREVLQGVDQANAERADQYNKVACEAQSLRNEAQKLRNLATEKISTANKTANKMADEADALIAEWNRTLSGLRRQADQIKAEMSEARQDQAKSEERAQELYADAQRLAEKHKETSLRPIDSEKLGHCEACNKWCPDLASCGVAGAEKQRADELESIIKAGKEAIALRGIHLDRIKEQAKKIDGLMSMEREVEARINVLGEAPTAPERTVITETPESLHLIGQAQELEATAEKLIKENRHEIIQKPTELVDELQNLNEQLTRGAATRQAQKNNDKINARIEELRSEESALITTQLQHKQHIAQLKEFYKQYADSVTASVNKLFDNTGYEIRLFESNMGNDKGVPVMQPMKEGNTNLCRSEAVIFGKFFVERVLSKYWNVLAPMLLDDTESLDSTEKLSSNHQVIAARVERHELEITNIE